MPTAPGSPAGSESARRTLEAVTEPGAITGEGPLWDAARDAVWWLDIPAGLLHRFDRATSSDTVTRLDASIGTVALRRDGTLLLGLADRIAALDPESGRLETLVPFDDGDRRRCNDGKPDRWGRFWYGRMRPDGRAGEGSLLCVGPGDRAEVVLDGLAMPNGIGWSPDERTMYYIDSSWNEVRAYPFDGPTGRLGPPRTLVGFPADGSVPDGLTVDAEACVWVARWGAGCIVRISPAGEPLDRVDLPVSQPSSCTFGGPDLDELYITTATEDLPPDRLAAEPLAGALFRCRPGVRGLPPDRAAI